MALKRTLVLDHQKIYVTNKQKQNRPTKQLLARVKLKLWRNPKGLIIA